MPAWVDAGPGSDRLNAIYNYLDTGTWADVHEDSYGNVAVDTVAAQVPLSVSAQNNPVQAWGNSGVDTSHSKVYHPGEYVPIGNGHYNTFSVEVTAIAGGVLLVTGAGDPHSGDILTFPGSAPIPMIGNANLIATVIAPVLGPGCNNTAMTVTQFPPVAPPTLTPPTPTPTTPYVPPDIQITVEDYYIIQGHKYAADSKLVYANNFKGLGNDFVTTDSHWAQPNLIFKRYDAIKTGTIEAIRIYGNVGIHTLYQGKYVSVKVALYSDAQGEPGTLITCVNEPTILQEGWNSITIDPTNIVLGTSYWISVLANFYNSSLSPTPYMRKPITGTVYSRNFRSRSLISSETYDTFTFPANPRTFVGALTGPTSFDLVFNIDAWHLEAATGHEPANIPVGGWQMTLNYDIATTTIVTTTTALGDNTNNGTQAIDAQTFGYQRFQQFTPATSGTIDSIKVKMNTWDARMRVALYSDVGGKPGTVLAQSNGWVPHTWSTDGWTTIPVKPGITFSTLTPSAQVIGSTPYWLAVVGYYTGTDYYYVDSFYCRAGTGIKGWVQISANKKTNNTMNGFVDNPTNLTAVSNIDICVKGLRNDPIPTTPKVATAYTVDGTGLYQFPAIHCNPMPQNVTISESLVSGWSCKTPGPSLTFNVDMTDVVGITTVGYIRYHFIRDHDFINLRGPVTYDQSHDMDSLVRKSMEASSVFTVNVAHRRTASIPYDLLIKKAHPSPLAMDILNQKVHNKGYPYDILNMKRGVVSPTFDIINMLHMNIELPADLLIQTTHNSWIREDVLVQGLDEESYAMDVRIQDTIVPEILHNTEEYIPQFPAVGVGYPRIPYPIFDSRKERKV